MAIAYISHPECLQHDTGEGHPENTRRILAIQDHLISTGLLDILRCVEAPEATDGQLLRVHTRAHLDALQAMVPATGHARVDPDTVVSPGSLQAARRAAGAVVAAVDLVASGEMESAFCCVRPPGHHAESDRAMGFCLFNNIAVGAAHALQRHGLQKVAILDFDVHHGNGTEEIFDKDERILFCSTFQHPFYPFTAVLENSSRRVNVPLEATAKSAEFRAAVIEHWLPALEKFGPQMLFVSAGFDAHRDDEMSNVSLTDDDYSWVTEQIVNVAATTASGRIVSTLEGGYERHSLARCVGLHIRAMLASPRHGQ